MALPHAPQPGTILLVEDCVDVRLGVAQLLELNGFRVTEAATGADALAQLSANPGAFALLLLDLLLPGSVSGRDLRARQLADPRLAQVPMVVVSACEPEVASQAALQPEAWLEKPFRGEQLLNVVRQFVRPEPGVGFFGAWTSSPQLPAH